MTQHGEYRIPRGMRPAVTVTVTWPDQKTCEARLQPMVVSGAEPRDDGDWADHIGDHVKQFLAQELKDHAPTDEKEAFHD